MNKFPFEKIEFFIFRLGLLIIFVVGVVKMVMMHL